MNSSWPEVLDALLKKAKADGLLESLRNIKNIHDIVEKVQDAPGVRRKLASWISHCSESQYQKSGGSATKLRNEGNFKFERGDFVTSHKLYSESVVCAPEYGPELSLAYGNRSATCYHLGNVLACLRDIELALKYKFPKDKIYKLYQRRGLCYLKLSRFEEAKMAFEEAKVQLPPTDLKKFPKRRREGVLKDIQAQIEETLSLESLRKRTTSLTLEEKDKMDHQNDTTRVSHGENESLPGASDSISVLTDEQGFRSVKAKRDLEVGDVLFSESPYATVLLSEHYSTHCYLCHKRLTNPIPCLKCTQARYCTEECRENSWNLTHRFECAHLDLLNSVGVASLALKILMVAGQDKVMAARPFLGQPCHTLSSSDPYLKVLSLVNHIAEMCVDDKFQYAVTSILLAMFLEQRTEFIPQSRRDTIKDFNVWTFVSAMLFVHVAQLVCNASAIFEVGSTTSLENEQEHNNSSPVYSQSQYRIATAIYPSYSMMNHSCNPSVINSFEDNRIVVRCIRPVAENGEVFNCYGPHYLRHKKSERQEQLLAQYHFKCSCMACQDKTYDDFLSKFTESLKCKFCSGPICLSESTRDHELPCMDCGREQNFSEQIKLVFEANRLNRLGSELFDRMDLVEASSVFEKCLALRKEAMYVHNENVAEIEDRLANCYAMMGRFEESLTHLRNSLKSVEERYGENSIEVSYELMKCSDLIEMCCRENHELEASAELIQVLTRASKIYLVHYGEFHPTYTSVIKKLKTLNVK